MLERWRRGLHREAPAEQGRAAPPELLHRQAQGLRAVRGRGQEDADAAAAGAAGTFRRSRDGTYATGARTCRRKSRWQNPF